MSSKIKKLISYFFVLIILVGFFSPSIISAEGADDGTGTSTTKAGSASEQTPASPAVDPCAGKGDGLAYDSCRAIQEAEKNKAPKSELEKNLEHCDSVSDWTFYGCMENLTYIVFFTLPSLLLWVSAQLFDSFIAISLSSKLFNASGFIPQAWTVVRDLSNIFFILILLYVAIEMILGIGHGTKKVIAQVVIMALLINFSMFMTKVVIDASNIIALVFYNKLNVNTTSNGQTIAFEPSTSADNEKGISGGIVNAFNPTRLLSEDFFNKAKLAVPGTNTSPQPLKTVPPSIIIGMLVVTGVIMSVAAYAFFVTGFYFLARMIELWVLIIFSPFAFMSSTLPAFSHLEYLGWGAWFKRLIAVSFMAPIFMFFMYFIFLLVHANIFGAMVRADGTMFETILLVIVPAGMILTLLMQATKFAKKGSGQVGEMVMNTAKTVGALTVGSAALGTAVLGRGVLGSASAALSRRQDSVNFAKQKFDYDKWTHGGRRGTPPPTPTALVSPLGRLGAKINLSQLRSGDVSHARHEMDELKKKVGVEGLSEKQLSGIDKTRMENEYIKSNRSEIESWIRRGYDAKGNELKNAAGVTIENESDFKARERATLVTAARSVPANYVPGTTELKDDVKKEIEDKLNLNFNIHLRDAGTAIGKEKYKVIEHESKEKVGMGTRMMARSTSGSYDPRNLSNMKLDKREGIGPKLTVGLIAAVAAGIRLGMKHSTGLDNGTPQREVLKDFGKTVEDALKNLKVSVSVGHKESAKDSHGTSGGGHH
jgi:hypothetical protein